MTRNSLLSTCLAALATAVIFTSSTTNATAGWGENGQFGNPVPSSTKSDWDKNGGYGGNASKTGNTGGWNKNDHGPSKKTGDSWGDRGPSKKTDDSWGDRGPSKKTD